MPSFTKMPLVINDFPIGHLYASLLSWRRNSLRENVVR